LEADGKIALDVNGESIELDDEDIRIRLQAKEGWAAAQGPSCVIVLSTELTPELIRGGHARDLVRNIQEQRKELGCEYTDRIEVGVVTDSDELTMAIEENRGYIQDETLAVRLTREPIATVKPTVHQIAGGDVQLYVKVVKASS
jgi:isoleucyl-tRNA synthetase